MVVYRGERKNIGKMQQNIEAKSRIHQIAHLNEKARSLIIQQNKYSITVVFTSLFVVIRFNPLETPICFGENS